MRLVFPLLVVLLTATPSAAQVRFADIPWTATGATTTAGLRAAGLEVADRPDEDGDYRFTGTLAGHKVFGFALMRSDSKTLGKIQVSLLTPDHKARAVYRDMQSMLNGKYGKPTIQMENFDKPYFEGDGYEDQAIRLGKGTFVTLWEGVDKASVGLSITEALSVALFYEGPDWSAESVRRTNKANRVF